ncbi:MAG: hypothetical protein A3K68_02665 [Euryarchaeota archaeon RBG_16_68_13]|nr:MAG: hypothetical protein A3K68_02665 [Euryarchaeota archaeon RBG_16_68_13]
MNPPPRKPRDAALTSLRPGTTGVVTAIEGDRDSRQQLYSLGILEGTEIRLVRRAPMGGALLVRVRGSQYALGPDVASRIRIAPR